MTDGNEADGEGALPREVPRIDEAEQLVANTEVHANAWEQTLEELWALEEEYEADGWDVIATDVGHTGTVAPVHRKGYWGLSHIVPDSAAEAIGEAVEAGEFPTYDVRRNTVQGRVFMVLTLLDPETDSAILLGTNFELRRATELVAHTHDVGYVDSIIRYLNGEVVAEIRHDEPSKFFPRYEEFETFAENWTAEPGVDGSE